MRISELLVKEFDPTVRSKGYSFFIRKQFKLLEVNPEDVRSEVYGVHKYNVVLQFQKESSGLKFECTCNQFKQGFNCPHIWASLLAVEKNTKTEDFASRILYVYQQKNSENMSNSSDAEKEKNGVFQNKDSALVPYWKRLLDKASESYQSKKVISESRFSQNEFLKKGYYIVDIPSSLSYRQLVLHFRVQEKKYNGEFGLIKKGELNQEKVLYFENSQEQQILWDLIGRVEKNYFSKSQATTYNEFLLNSEQSDSVLSRISELNQLYRLKKVKTGIYVDFQVQDMMPYPLRNETWYLDLHLYEFDKEDYKLTAILKNDKGETREVKEVQGYLDKYIFFEDFMAYFDSVKYGTWFEALVLKPMIISKDEVYDFLNTYWMNYSNPPNIHLPSELKFDERHDIDLNVKVILNVSQGVASHYAEIQFVYETYAVDGNYQEYILDLPKKLKIKRNHGLESKFLQEFSEISPQKSTGFRSQFRFYNSQLVEVIDKLSQKGWQVYLNRTQLKKVREIHFKPSQQVDWLDLKIDIKVDEQNIKWEEVLTALKNNSNIVQLSDGSSAFISKEILQKIKPFLEVGQTTEEGIKLNRIQSLFLKSYVDSDLIIPDKQLDQILNDLRELKPVKLNPKFKGELRDYQKNGVSWLSVLGDNSLGGILADDMGLGKTIQMLAVLSRSNKGVSLVVAPKSLVFNWKNEFEKFAPHMKVLTYFGSERKNFHKEISSYDVLLTTYHTLRNDIEFFKDLKFYYFILDEAQNIKNPKSQLTLSTKMIQSEKKFALTGTPIENSVGDLLSILSVVTPGLISESLGQKFQKMSEEEDMKKLSKALSPFILRRTKEQVLNDLPQKTEQLLFNELSEDERTKYEEIRNFYWKRLNSKIKENGINNSKIEILGALLRLRQVCSHAGLVEKKNLGDSSSKIDLLIDQLKTIINEGHKALVFSSFTSLLKIVATQLHEKNISFEYLDGQTKDRKERVDNFQNNEQINVFLLSLKAGGVGLNLTSADYVFILDPWWNPAAESQAIDRCYRIGQTKKVFAYKIITKNTVEEKILKLQERKKNLANNIISSDAHVLKELSFSDLSELFS